MMSKSEEEQQDQSPQDKSSKIEKRRLRRSLVARIGFTLVAVAQTILNALQGDINKTSSSAQRIITTFSDTIDSDDKLIAQKEEPGLGTKIFRIFANTAMLGLGVFKVVFKAIGGDIIGAAGDIGGIIASGVEVVSSAMPFLGSKTKKEPAPPGRFSKFIAPMTTRLSKVTDVVKSVPDRIIKRLEKSRAGRIALRAGSGLYNIATSKHVKVMMQIITAAMAMAAATTPLGWAVAGLAFVSIGIAGVKALLDARSLRRLHQKRDALAESNKEKGKQLRLLAQNPELQQMLKKNQLVESKALLGDKPQRANINIGAERLNVLATNLAGGGGAILQAVAAGPAMQAAVAFILLGGVGKEAKANIKEKIARSDLNEEAWELGGSNKSLALVQSELLQDQRKTIALTLLIADIEQTKSLENIPERLNKFMQDAEKLKKSPTAGEKIQSAFNGFGSDCYSALSIDRIKEGWRELRGVNEDPSADKSPKSSAEMGVERAPPEATELEVEAPKAPTEIDIKIHIAALEAIKPAALHLPPPKPQSSAYPIKELKTEPDVKESALEVTKEVKGHITGDTHARAPHQQKQDQIKLVK